MKWILIPLLVLAARRDPVRPRQGRDRHGPGQGHYRPALAGADAQAHPLPGDRDRHRGAAAADDEQLKEPALVRLNKIYTRTGDAGETGLVDGSRVSKADPRLAAIGDVDEANSAIGVALLRMAGGAAKAMLARIQNELFDLGADLATPGEDFAPGEMTLRIVAEQIDRLEREIDKMNEDLEPLKSFILPGGGAAAAYLHLARSITRRAERSAVAAARSVSLNPLALTYINRLSDHLFVMARWTAREEGGDVLWQPGATRGA